MAGVAEDVELAELLAILAAVAVGGYLIYSYLKGATCIAKVGAVPGVTGATKGQATAASDASAIIKPGGAVVWSCGSCYDYLQPCGQTVTEARSNWADKIPIFNNWTTPVKYSCVPATCYDFSSDSAMAGLRAVLGAQ